MFQIPSSNERWVRAVLSPALDDSVIILDTGCTQDITIDFIHKQENITTDQVCSNIWEAALILYLVKALSQVILLIIISELHLFFLLFR